MRGDLEFDPRLMEEAVFLALKGAPGERAFRREREACYPLQDPEERERAFFDLHSRWFRSLGIGAPVRRAIHELGGGLSAVSRWLIIRAASGRQSAAEMYVAAEGRRSVVVRILPGTLAHPDEALFFLRCELLHVSDMLDPCFEYTPHLPRSPLGPPDDRRVRDRYAVLWRTSVEGRLALAGKLPPHHRDACLAAFGKAFGCLGSACEECFERIWSGERPLHAVFVALATEPEEAFGLERRSPRRGRRCPLCGFPTVELDPAGRFPLRMRKEIRRDFPSWTVRQGICTQCADLYRSLSERPESAGRIPDVRTACGSATEAPAKASRP